MNSIKNVPARVLSRRTGHSLEAEREQFDKTQAMSISKAINTQEAPVKEKHVRRIILGTHHEKGAFTFWSYAIGLPLPSSSILSWKFCHVLHKVLRDGHPNVLQDCQRYRSNIRETGDLWVSSSKPLKPCSVVMSFVYHQQKNQEQSLQQKLRDDQFAILQGTVTEAENIIQDAVAKLDDPLHIRCTSSPDYLISRVQAALESVTTLESGHAQYVSSMADATELVGALAQFAHLTADAIVNGSATSHMAPTDHADKLTDTCRDCGHRSLEYLNELKDKQLLRQANPEDVRRTLQGILQLGQELRPKSLDIKQEELGRYSLNSAWEAAKLFSLVPNRILNSCTDLMKAIRLLVMTSTSLQKEIVESGRGAATTQEFYAKNSRWTEGLISASKAVGWGATQLVESADRVVLHTGKYEELIVCSHEIAASTAQLVAASKVKADKNSRNLGKLQACSRNVNEMAANVVASTKSGQEQIEDKDTMDFSGMSLIKLKKEEMETQVKVLELEKMLENERIRLGDLRKKHYALAGVYEDPDDGEGKPAGTPRRGMLKKPPLAQKPAYPLKQDGELEQQDGVYQAHVVNF
uniref:I/LWEQ domain-containing protein n=1 Tax=Pelusios castaneus TaxID=367368 RepID=A0A8C8RE38_9SAUR